MSVFQTDVLSSWLVRRRGACKTPSPSRRQSNATSSNWLVEFSQPHLIKKYGMLCLCRGDEGCSLCPGLDLCFTVSVKVSSQSGSQSMSTARQHVWGTDSRAVLLSGCVRLCVHVCKRGKEKACGVSGRSQAAMQLWCSVKHDNEG